MVTLVDASTVRCDMLVSASVRAGYAWTQRFEETDAWLELARMTGVVMTACGPGRGPTTPSELVEALRRPLAEMVPGFLNDTPIGDVIVLDGDELDGEVLERCCEHVVDVLNGHDSARRWLPSWTWMQRELVENKAFHRLYDGASDSEYTASRRFVIEHPAGAFADLVEELNTRGIERPSVDFDTIPSRQLYQDAFWWPCPVCKWPMSVSGLRVSCAYTPHSAEFFIRVRTGSRGTPLLQRRDASIPHRPPAARRFLPDGAMHSVCVPESVWRHIVVSGVTELALFTWLERQQAKYPSLLEIELFPGKDAADVRVAIGNLGWSTLLDVKDVFDVSRLAEEIRARSLTADTVVLPDFRGQSQRDLLRDLLPSQKVLLVDDVKKQVRGLLVRAARESK